MVLPSMASSFLRLVTLPGRAVDREFAVRSLDYQAGNKLPTRRSRRNAVRED